MSPAFLARPPAIARRECASNWKQLRRCLPRLLLRGEAISWLSHFLPSRRPISFRARGFSRTESRLPWPAHRAAARVRAPYEVDQAPPSIFVALQERLFPFAILP